MPVVNMVDDENYPTDFLYVVDCVETTPMNVNRLITSLAVSTLDQSGHRLVVCVLDSCSLTMQHLWYTVYKSSLIHTQTLSSHNGTVN